MTERVVYDTIVSMNKLCLNCHKKFEAYNKGQKYCSKKCGWAGWFKRNKDYKDAYQKKYQKVYYSNPINRNKQRIYQRGWRRLKWDEMRKLILNKYGNKCNRCGFTDPRALQIDHVNGGGVRESREKYGYGVTKSGYNIHARFRYYQDVLKDKTGKYQILCANCNWIKKCVNKELSVQRICV